MHYIETIGLRTGLDEREIMLLARCYNGIMVAPVHAPELGRGGVLLGRHTLLNAVGGEAANAHAEVARFGTWLETMDGDPEQPFALNDLQEKLRVLSDEQATALFWYVLGWWDGCDVGRSFDE